MAIQGREAMIKHHLGTLVLLLGISFEAFAGPFDPWNYATPITINNSNAEALTDHQVLLTIDTASLVGAGKLNADGSDLRFVSDDFSTVLPYWVESGMNSAATAVWVRVPNVPAAGSVDIQMVYGNAAGAAASDASATFDLFEDFSVDLGEFSAACGTPANTVSGGVASLSWSSSGLYSASTTFPQSDTYIVEADVESINGNWPGIYWGTAGLVRYGLLADSADIRISVKGGGSDSCSGHNWTSSLEAHGGAVGVWSLAWPDTGDLRAQAPAPVGALTSADTLYARDADLSLYIGGISSGTGGIDVDWIRVRKFADNDATSAAGAEVNLLQGGSGDPRAMPKPVPVLPAGGLLVLIALLGLVARRRLG